jgi:hypothetical protein
MLRGPEKRHFEFERRRGLEWLKRDAWHRVARDHGLFPRLWRHARDILGCNQVNREHEFRVPDIWQLDDADASDFKLTCDGRGRRGEEAIASRLDKDLIVGNKHRRVRGLRRQREEPESEIGFA